MYSQNAKPHFHNQLNTVFQKQNYDILERSAEHSLLVILIFEEQLGMSKVDFYN
jgi:hypothetical protein